MVVVVFIFKTPLSPHRLAERGLALGGSEGGVRARNLTPHNHIQQYLVLNIYRVGVLKHEHGCFLFSHFPAGLYTGPALRGSVHGATVC